MEELKYYIIHDNGLLWRRRILYIDISEYETKQHLLRFNTSLASFKKELRYNPNKNRLFNRLIKTNEDYKWIGKIIRSYIFLNGYRLSIKNDF